MADIKADLPTRGDESYQAKGGAIDPSEPGYTVYRATIDGVTSGRITREQGDAAIAEARKGGTSVAKSASMLAGAMGEKAGEGLINVWDSIPSWVKWGTLGAVVAYVAGPTIIESLLPRRQYGTAED